MSANQEQKHEEIWNNSQCPQEIARSVLNQLFHFPDEFFDKSCDRCYCILCHSLRNDKLVYSRGNPSKDYALPIEWVRFGLRTDPGKCKVNKVFDEWHVGFHGTSKEDVYEIFKSGLILLKPGDHTIDGNQLKMRSGHIKKPFNRYNEYSKQNELFDPNQIFVSPSIKYVSQQTYAGTYYCCHPQDWTKTLKVQFAFQLRIKPGSYGIGQETIGATKNGKKLDENFNNEELEWYTKQNLGIVLYGLLMRVEEQ